MAREGSTVRDIVWPTLRSQSTRWSYQSHLIKHINCIPDLCWEIVLVLVIIIVCLYRTGMWRRHMPEAPHCGASAIHNCGVASSGLAEQLPPLPPKKTRGTTVHVFIYPARGHM